MLFFSPTEGSVRHTGRIDAAARRKLFLSYLPDWTITIVLAAIFFSLNDVSGFKRQFSLTDTSLRHTFALKERVPDFALYLIAIVSPFTLQIVINFITIRTWWDFHASTLGLILGLSLTGVVTQFTKITVGRPRPDVIDRCQPPPGSVDPIFGLSNFTICTQTNSSIMNDGFRSFPSGHSSLSFAGLGFLAFYLAGKLHLFDHRGHAGKAWISMTPFAGAALVAISRTMDYRHHWQDVLAGAILGTVMAYFSYRQYYPSLASEMSHRPYSPRIKLTNVDVLPTHRRHGSTSALAPDTYDEPGVGIRGYTDDPSNPEDHELEQTVKRPGPGPLREVWKTGAESEAIGSSGESAQQTV